MAEKKTKEQLKAEADARRASAKEKQEAHLKKIAELRATNKQKSLDAMAAKKEERERKLNDAVASAAAKKEERLKLAEQAKANRIATIAAAQEARLAAKAGRRGTAPTAPAEAKPARGAAAERPSARAAAAVAAPAAKKAPVKAEPVSIGIGVVLPTAVERELDRAIKTATMSIRDQVNNSLKLPADLDKRELSRLESSRKKLIGGFESLIAVVSSRISASRISSTSLSLDPATGRAQFAPFALEVANPLRSRIALASKDLLAVMSDPAAAKAFPALFSPFMLQFFGDLDTGQVLDGSLIMTFNSAQPSETSIAYKVTLGSASKKVKGPALKLEFSHNLGADKVSGSAQFGFPIALPAEPPKN
jgi:hypothetical protein